MPKGLIVILLFALSGCTITTVQLNNSDIHIHTDVVVKDKD